MRGEGKGEQVSTKSPSEAHPSSRVIVDRRTNTGVAIAAVIVTLVIVAGFVASRSRPEASGTPTPTQATTTVGSTGAPIGTPAPAGTNPTVPEPTFRELSISASPMSCEVRNSSEPSRAQGLGFTPATAQPSALIPGSASLLSWNDPDFNVSVIAGSDYVVLAWAGGVPETQYEVGHIDPVSGQYHRSFSASGCDLDTRARLVLTTNSGAHLWALFSDANQETFVSDVDLDTGNLVWSARCSGCQALAERANQLYAVGDVAPNPIFASGQNSWSGSGEAFAIGVDTHEIASPIRFEGALVTGDGPMLTFDGRSIARRRDDASIEAYVGVLQQQVASGPLSDAVFQAGGKVWTVTYDGTSKRLTGHAADTFDAGAGIPIPCDQVWLASGRIWYAGRAACGGQGLSLEAPIVSLA